MTAEKIISVVIVAALTFSIISLAGKADDYKERVKQLEVELENKKCSTDQELFKAKCGRLTRMQCLYERGYWHE